MLLDTNAYTALAKGLPAIIDTISDATELALPLPVIAELRYGFAKGSQPDHNVQVLQRFLAQDHVSIVIPTLKTTEFYAATHIICRRQGKVLSHNDLWIAALARETGLPLITFDQDFAVLSGILGNRLVILE